MSPEPHQVSGSSTLAPAEGCEGPKSGVSTTAPLYLVCRLQERLFLSLIFLHPQSHSGGWRRGVLICLKDRKKIRLWLRKIFSRPGHFLFFSFFTLSFLEIPRRK